jgi:polar amino acid transport system permease protein
MVLKFGFLLKYYQYYISGLQMTLFIAFFAVLCGIIWGVCLALMRLSRFKLPHYFAVCYINFIRGTPLLVQIYLIYFGLASLINLPDMVAAVASLSINSGAYVAEIVRAGIEAVDKGQAEAARSLGLTKFQSMRFVILPQAIKNILPALCNEFIIVTKDTSMVSVIGLHELMFNADTIRGRTYLPFEPLIIAALIYFSISYVLTKGIGILERRLKKSD